MVQPSRLGRTLRRERTLIRRPQTTRPCAGKERRPSDCLPVAANAIWPYRLPSALLLVSGTGVSALEAVTAKRVDEGDEAKSGFASLQAHDPLPRLLARRVCVRGARRPYACARASAATTARRQPGGAHVRFTLGLLMAAVTKFPVVHP